VRLVLVDYNIWSIFIELLGSACQSASLLFQRSCSGLYTANSFWWDWIVALSTIFHRGLRVTWCASCGVILMSWKSPNSARHCMVADDVCPVFPRFMNAAFHVPDRILTCSRLLWGPRSWSVVVVRPPRFLCMSCLAVVTCTSIIWTIACSTLHAPTYLPYSFCIFLELLGLWLKVNRCGVLL